MVLIITPGGKTVIKEIVVLQRIDLGVWWLICNRKSCLRKHGQDQKSPEVELYQECL